MIGGGFKAMDLMASFEKQTNSNSLIRLGWPSKPKSQCVVSTIVIQVKVLGHAQ